MKSTAVISDGNSSFIAEPRAEPQSEVKQVSEKSLLLNNEPKTSVDATYKVNNTSEKICEPAIVLDNQQTIPQMPQKDVLVQSSAMTILAVVPTSNKESFMETSLTMDDKCGSSGTKEVCIMSAKKTVANNDIENVALRGDYVRLDSSLVAQSDEEDAVISLLSKNIDQLCPLNTSNRRVYDRDFLIKLRNKPQSRIKPKNLLNPHCLKGYVVSKGPTGPRVFKPVVASQPDAKTRKPMLDSEHDAFRYNAIPESQGASIQMVKIKRPSINTPKALSSDTERACAIATCGKIEPRNDLKELWDLFASEVSDRPTDQASK